MTVRVRLGDNVTVVEKANTWVMGRNNVLNVFSETVGTDTLLDRPSEILASFNRWDSVELVQEKEEVKTPPAFNIKNDFNTDELTQLFIDAVRQRAKRWNA